MRECEDVLRELPAYLGRELPSPDIAAIDAHLRVCEGCRRALADLGEMVRLVPMAPLEHSPRADLEDHVFGLIELDDVARLAAHAPLEHEPPLGLERRALDRAGVLQRAAPGRWPRVATVLAPGLAIATVALAVIGANWRSDARQLQTTLSNVAGSQTPVGQTMAAASFVGPAASATGELVDLSEEKYQLVLSASYFPMSPPGFHYEVWLIGKNGVAPAGTFTVERSGPIRESFSVGVDPRAYPVVRITREPDNGSENSSEWTVMEGRFDVGD